MLETSAFRISVRWPIYVINSVDKIEIFDQLLWFQLSTSNFPTNAEYCKGSLVNFIIHSDGNRLCWCVRPTSLLTFFSRIKHPHFLWLQISFKAILSFIFFQKCYISCLYLLWLLHLLLQRLWRTFHLRGFRTM